MMTQAFDLVRRRRPTPTRPPARSDRRAGVGLFVILFVAAIIIALASNRVASDSLPLTISPSVTFTPLLKTTSPTATPTIISASPTPTPSQTPSPTPTFSDSPSPIPTELSKASITIRLLNGSGTPGQAAILQTSLKKAGFTVRSIATAKTRRANTIIYYAADRRPEADLVASFIDNRLLVFEENSNLAKPDTLLIIVGAK